MEIPILKASPGGLAERLAASLGRTHPIVVFLMAVIVGFAAIAGLSIAVGFCDARAAARVGSGRGRRAGRGLAYPSSRADVDGRLADRLDHRRRRRASRSRRDDYGRLSRAAEVADRGLRRLRTGRRVASYRATTLVVHRDRPSVPRLEHLPVNASYPSGHTAAAIAVYGGLVLLLTSWSRTASSGCSPGRSRSLYRSSSPSRACIAECTIPGHCRRCAHGNRRPDRACFRLPGGGRRRGIASRRERAPSAGRGDKRRGST